MAKKKHKSRVETNVEEKTQVDDSFYSLSRFLNEFFKQNIYDILQKELDIINSNNFKKVFIFDNYDYDYDPNEIINNKKIDYDFFKFVHNKKAVNKITKPIDTNDYLYPMIVDNKLYVGGYKMDRLWHYHDKNVPEDLDARIF